MFPNLLPIIGMTIKGVQHSKYACSDATHLFLVSNAQIWVNSCVQCNRI